MDIIINDILKDIDDENTLERLQCKRNSIIWNILDDYSASKYKPYTNNALLIRMLEPIRHGHKYDLDIQHEKNFKKILEIRCDDIVKKNRADLVLFNQAQADLIKKTIYEEKYEEIVVHCGAGISRSSAVMLSIAEYLNDKDMIRYIKTIGFYIPNKHIHNLLSKTLLNINK